MSLTQAAQAGRSWSVLWSAAAGGGGPDGLSWLTLPLAGAALATRRRRPYALFFAVGAALSGLGLVGLGGLLAWRTRAPHGVPNPG